jgi:hypothetical protein
VSLQKQQQDIRIQHDLQKQQQDIHKQQQDIQK